MVFMLWHAHDGDDDDDDESGYKRCQHWSAHVWLPLVCLAVVATGLSDTCCQFVKKLPDAWQ
jgi:ABC-type Zn2+ transport system substrate-binding protein/surface adhesin